jgi:signal transduction histidine kinase
MSIARPRPTSRIPQIRPVVAKLQRGLTLRVRLGLLVALVVSVVVGISSWLQVGSFTKAARASLVETARSTAQAVADDIEVQDPATIADREAMRDNLVEFRNAVPTVKWISAFAPGADGKLEVYASTGVERQEASGVALRAVQTHDEAWGDPTEVFQTVAMPVYHPADRVWGAVAVTFSLASIDDLDEAASHIVFWFVPPVIIALTLLVDLLARRLIHQPIGGIRSTMQRAAEGDLSVRAPVARRDEIGVVAEGLNEMLARMENFNESLQARVREATSELRDRNAQLVESYQRVFALREALARADQMAAVGQTAASVAHQIGTPLNLISGYVQILMEEAGEASRSGRRLALVQEQIRKVTVIVRTMLDHARRTMPKVQTDAAQLVERVCEVARPKLDAAGVRLELSVDRHAPRINADAVQLELALLNLVTNGLDAMPAGGTLSAGVTTTPAGVRLRIADTGTGIDPELLPRIFEPWVTTKGAGRGSGLGLSITREVVAAHGGTIAVSSRPGEGTEFTIDLPAAPAEVS